MGGRSAGRRREGEEGKVGGKGGMVEGMSSRCHNGIQKVTEWSPVVRRGKKGGKGEKGEKVCDLL